MRPPSIRTLKTQARQAATMRGHSLGDFCCREHPCVVNYVAVCKHCHRIALVCDQGFCGDATKTFCPEDAA
jgi:hypothetical protein